MPAPTQTESQPSVANRNGMQHRSLTIGSLIDHAAHAHAGTEIVARSHSGAIQRSSWAQVKERAARVASALAAAGFSPGDRVATLAWNRLAHLELYFGVTSGGYVLHTVNPRLHKDHLAYIINDGGARLLCVEPDLLYLIAPIRDQLHHVQQIVVLGDAEGDVAEQQSQDFLSYEHWLAQASPLKAWPSIEETAPSTLCYTSGTTGKPKGVLYTHRSTVLHAMSACMADSMALTARDSIALVTPLFHVNAWGVPFAAAACGAKLVLPGSALDPASLLALMAEEGVTFALGVPTVWMGFLDHLRALGENQPALALNRVFVGGAAPSPALIDSFRALLGIDTMQAWGMTETSPVVTVNRPLAHQMDLPAAQRTQLQTLQGRTVFGVEIRIVNAAGDPLPQDGVAIGRLEVRGHWVIDHYYNAQTPAVNAEGWLDTGDIAQITADGFLRLTDRAKDVIKSGGEWISSIDLENAAMSFEGITEAAVIGVAHPRWQERPLMLVTLHADASLDRDALREHLALHVARWWLPDDIIAVAKLPHSATGKLLKYELREQFANHRSGQAQGADVA